MKALLPLALTALLAGCASTPDVNVDHDPNADFSKYHTYYWAQELQISNPLAKQRVIAGIDARMAAKGFTKQEGSGDLAIVGNVATQERANLDTFYTGTGMYGWGWGPGWGYGGVGSTQTRVNYYTVGTLVLDMFDTATKKAVWRGVASGTVPDSPEKTEAAVNAGLDKMFAGFPPGAAPAK